MISLSVTLIAPLLLPCPQDEEQPQVPLEVNRPPASFSEALTTGVRWTDLRLRAENVDEAGMDNRSLALTLRGAVGLESATYKDFTFGLELEGVTNFGVDTYNDTLNGDTSRPMITDPASIELNQAWAHYGGVRGYTLRLGRQKLDLGNGRLVGSEPWRQNDRTFDAVTVTRAVPNRLTLTAAYIYNVNGVTSSSSPLGDTESSSLLLHGSYPLGNRGVAEAYSYELDLDHLLLPATRTVGARAEGEVDVLGRGLDFSGEFANQRDSSDNPDRVDAGYAHLSLGAQFAAITYTIGHEILQGSNAPGNKFTTPLGSVHTFNGLADMFVTTPMLGLDDTYYSMEGTWNGFQVAATYHQFASYRDSQNYGTELDLTLTRVLDSGLRTGLGTADYQADGFGVDTLKAWVWMAYSF
ncbi:hypothetical protein CMO84_10120 [Candidatus Woesearchaeota archaeon]|jgi:hypothetical protein|nr:hypothetical protein [Candidatus Woesearchaeota archaeon]MDP6937866.1 alginate export family protein [Planctomycetota bacterium]